MKSSTRQGLAGSPVTGWLVLPSRHRLAGSTVTGWLVLLSITGWLVLPSRVGWFSRHRLAGSPVTGWLVLPSWVGWFSRPVRLILYSAIPSHTLQCCVPEQFIRHGRCQGSLKPALTQVEREKSALCLMTLDHCMPLCVALSLVMESVGSELWRP